MVLAPQDEQSVVVVLAGCTNRSRRPCLVAIQTSSALVAEIAAPVEVSVHPFSNSLRFSPISFGGLVIGSPPVGAVGRDAGPRSQPALQCSRTSGCSDTPGSYGSASASSACSGVIPCLPASGRPRQIHNPWMYHSRDTSNMADRRNAPAVTRCSCGRAAHRPAAPSLPLCRACR